MQVLIAGAGSVGRSIARELLSHGHQVTLVDVNPEAMKIASVSKAEWILGDCCSPDVLTEAKAESTDVVVAATGDDRANLVISLLAKTQFGVPRVVGRVNNPKNEWMFDEAWGVDVQVSTPRIMTSLVEEAVSVGTLVPIFRFQHSGAAMYSTVVEAGAPLADQRYGDITWPPHVVLAALLRDGRPLNPVADDVISARDELLLLIDDAGLDKLEELHQLVSAQQQPGEVEG